jgi:hypothetical protein
MLYFKLNEKLEVVEISSKFPDELQPPASAPWYRRADGSYGPGGWLNRNDIDSFMFAGAIADAASKFSDKVFLAEDSGPNVSPRYDVIEAPKVGDDVSKGFNGDFYPVGKIIKIGKDYKRIYVEGERGPMVFYRKKLSGAWLYRGMWSLVPGVRNEWNPEF